MVEPMLLSRTKAVVLLFVVLAILYVLISPLPEMAATKLAHCFDLAFVSLFVLLMPPSDLVLSGLLGVPRSQLEECCDLQAVLCSRLC